MTNDELKKTLRKYSREAREAGQEWFTLGVDESKALIAALSDAPPTADGDKT